MKRSFVGVLLLSALLTGSVWAASLTTIETIQEEKEQVLRIRAQGALPYQVLEQTSDTLVLFLPHSTLGNLPSYFSFQPLADMRLEANPIGLQVRLENIDRPFRIRPSTKPGQLDIVFKPLPPAATPTTSTPSTGSTATTVAPQLAPPLPTCPVGSDGKPLTISTSCQPPGSSSVGTTGSISDEAVEDADPIRPGVPTAPKRPVKP
jgi:hypothetical protein